MQKQGWGGYGPRSFYAGRGDAPILSAMGDQPVTLDFIVRIVRDLQADVRNLKLRIGIIEIDLVA